MSITGYKLSRDTSYSAVATPGLAPNPAAALARWNPSWTEIRSDNSQILPARDLAVLYSRIWTLSAGTSPARRAQTITLAAATALGGTRAFFDNGIRLTCRNAATRFPRNWASGMTASEQAAVLAAAAAHTVSGGYPQMVTYNTLIAPPPPGAAGAGVPGHFVERLPEFLCQLGGKTNQNMFL